MSLWEDNRHFVTSHSLHKWITINQRRWINVLTLISACQDFIFLIVNLQHDVLYMFIPLKPWRVKLNPFPFKPVQSEKYSNINVGGVYFKLWSRWHVHFPVVNDGAADPQWVYVDVSVQCVLCSYKWHVLLCFYSQRWNKNHSATSLLCCARCLICKKVTNSIYTCESCINCLSWTWNTND